MKHSALLIIAILLFSFLASSFIIKPASSASGLVGYWKFDEGSGTTAFDSSGNGNIGVLYDSPTWVNGKSGKALSFDGSDDYVRIERSSSLDATSEVTVEAWICPRAYVSGLGDNSHIVSRTNTGGGHVYVLSLYPDSHKASYSVNPFPDQHASNADIQLNVWTHLTMTYDGSYVRLYINGEFDSSYELSGAIETTPNWLAIGCNSYGSTYAHFNGTIDEVRIYNRALSQEEIRSHIPYESLDWAHEGCDLENTRFYPHASDTIMNPHTPFGIVWNSSDVDVVAGSGSNLGTGDVNGDGRREVIVARSGSSNITVLDYEGAKLWTRSVPDDCEITGMRVAPSGLDLCDANSDGALEIFVAAKSGDASYNRESRILVYLGNGTLVKQILTPNCDAIRGIACTDLDFDGYFEVVAAISAGYPLTPRGIYVYDYTSSLEKWNYALGPVPFLDAVADIDGDEDLEIIAGTFAPHNGHSANGMDDSHSYVVALHHDGSELWHSQIGTLQTHSSVADMDNDGLREVVTFRSQDSIYYPGPNNVYLLNSTVGSIVDTFNGPNNEVCRGWSIADLDNNSMKEVVYAAGDNVLSVLDKDLVPTRNLTLSVKGSIQGPGSVLPINDINGDGKLEIVVLTEDENVTVLDSELNKLWSFPLQGTSNAIVSNLQEGEANEIIVSAATLCALSLGRGPRMASLTIKYYSDSNTLYDALKTGEVDVTNLELNKTQMEDAFNDANIQTAISPSFSILQFDLNNNATIPTYPDLTSPTAYKTFRQGIAYLVNKTHIVNDIFSYAHRIDSPIPRPYGDWWVDWSVSQYDSYGNLLGNYPYEYDLSLADYYFNQSGFVQGNETNPYYNASFPNSAQFLRIHPETGITMEPLIFYARNDIEHRVEAARTLRDSLRVMGVPVDLFEVNLVTFYNKVLIEGDYHVVLGGWSWTPPPYPTGPDFLDIYTSKYAVTEGTMTNYVQFRNTTYDEFAHEAVYPSNLTLAREAALKCQRILVEEAVCVWLLTRSHVMGYRNMYGVANSVNSELVDNRWTFLAAQMQAANDTEIDYGVARPPTALNIVTHYTFASTQDCLDRIYDTLLTFSPYDRIPNSGTEPMPWMAEDWEISTWESPYNPSENLTKLTFYLRDGIKWHDGVELNSSDVKFTIDYLRQIGNDAALYYLVSDVDHVTTPNAHTVVVYENVTGTWTLGYIGTLPILPKHVFQSITNVTGYTPGADEGHPASETLIGSGPWKYVFHNSSGLWLEANRDYFMETPPIGEVDFRYDWEMGCYVVDNMDETMAGEACWTYGTGVQSERWEPGCDVNGDYTVNTTDMSVIAGKFNVTWGHSAKRIIAPPSTNCTIYIEPSENQVLVGENLTVYVKLMNAVNLSGVQFKLNYDNNRLECFNLAVTQLLFGDFTVEARKEVNQTNGFVWVALSLSNLAQPISGNMTLATITFHASKPGNSLLDLWNTKLATYGAPGSTCQLMPHKIIDGNVLIGVPTPSGTNVTVAPTQNVNITFTEVASPGVTTLNMTQPPQIPFITVNCIDIKTTANYSGNITIQFAYDPTGLSLEQEQALKLWLWNETALNWVDITTYVNTTSNIIYGETPHLSIFGITSDLLLYGDLSIFGITTVRTPSSPPLPPNGLVALNYYEVFTTKQPQEPIEIRLAYNAGKVRPEVENLIQAWVWNELTSNWTDITTYVNTTSKDVYGLTPHLSIFGITCIAPPPNEIAVIDSTCSKNVVGQGYNLTVNFIIENQGGRPEFDIIIYRNSTVFTTHHVSNLAVNTQTTLSFTWNTINWPKGRYGISAHGQMIMWIDVVVPGDVNADHYVGIDDIFTIATHFGQEPGHPSWNSIYDIAGDNYVGIDDIFTAASHFGEEG